MSTKAIRKIKLLLFISVLALSITGCGAKAASTASLSIASSSSVASSIASSSLASKSQEEKSYTKSDIKKLKNTGIFTASALEHIFNGSVNSSGNASGYHYDMITDSDGRIIGSKGKPDANGVYTAKVEVKGKTKSGNNGYSTFYPDKLSPQEVVDLINEAYKNREHVSSNIYSGEAGGIIINMYLDDNKKIISAFPVMD